MHAAALTDHQRAAVQAYLRLLSTVRAALDTEDTGGATVRHTPRAASGPPSPQPPHHAPTTAHPPFVPPSLLADADARLAAAGLAGNESEFFALLRAWCPDIHTTDG